MSAQFESILTVDDLDLLPDDGNRYELIEGEIFVSRAPSLTHQVIVSNLIALFHSYLNSNPIGIVVPGPGVIFSKINGVIPDVVFMSHERRKEIASSGDRIGGGPNLVIEIVSPGAENERRDRIVKRHLYGRYGVEEYWIVDPEKRFVEIYRLHEQELRLAATLKDEDRITTPTLHGFTIETASIFKD